MQHSLTLGPEPASSPKPRRRRGKVSKEDRFEVLLAGLEIILTDDISKVFAFGDARAALRWDRMTPRERAEWVVMKRRRVAA